MWKFSALAFKGDYDMDMKQWDSNFSTITDLLCDATELRKVLSKEPYDHDSIWIDKLIDKLFHISDLLIAERFFLLTILELEEEKNKFIAQKNMHGFIKDALCHNMNYDKWYRLTNWKFTDYRVKKIQDDLRNNMKSLCDFYQKEYMGNS